MELLVAANRCWRSLPCFVRWALAGLGITAAVGGIVVMLGFSSGGIVAGSPAAAIMASYNGAVHAGSFCAVAQSIGAAGIPASVYAYAGLGSAMAALLTQPPASPV